MEEIFTTTRQDVTTHINDIDFSKLALSDIVSYIIQFGKNVFIAIIVYFLGRLLIKYAVKMLTAVTHRRHMEASLASFLHSLISISLNGLLIVTIIGILGIDTSSFLAVFASAGIAVGMALSGTLQNFGGGVLILLLKPYKVGDFIEVQGFAGTVREIQIIHTILTTADNQTIYLPNGLLATGSLKNSTAAPTRRVDIDVEVAYGSDPDHVREVLNHIMKDDERILQEAPLAPFIPMTALSTSSIVFQMRMWTDAKNYWGVKFDTTEKVYKELTKAGIEIPFPQMDVHIK